MMCDIVVDGKGSRCIRCGAFFKTTGRVFARCQQLDLSKEPQQLAKCGGCTQRQETVNKIIPGAGDLVAKLADPIADAIGWKEKSLFLNFSHGLGDAVQFGVVLRHLRQLFPEWKVDIGAASQRWDMLRGCGARECFPYAQPRGEHVHTLTIPFQEPENCYPGTPSTKAERCLRQMFGIEPVVELCKYHVPFREAHAKVSRKFLATLPPSRGVVLIHYQGKSARRVKNINEQIVRDVCNVTRNADCVPVLLDWDDRSRLVAGEIIHRANIPGEPCHIAALAARAKLCIGIDSGPGHVFGSDTLTTPTLIVWRKHHPVHYYELADHVTHVVPPNHEQYLRGDVTLGRDVFERLYHHSVRKKHLRYALPELVRERLK